MVYLSKIRKEQDIRFIAIFPEYDKNDPIYDIFKANNVEYYNVPICNALYFTSISDEIKKDKWKVFQKNIETLKTFCQSIQLDVLVSNCTLVTEVAFVARSLGIKYVIYIRGILNPVDFPKDYQKFSQLRAIEKQVLEQADFVVTQSAFTAKLWGLDHRSDLRYTVIPLGYLQDGEVQPLEEREGPLEVLVLSGLEANKNQGILLDTANWLKKKEKKVVFHIYGVHGDNTYKNWMESEILKQELETCIIIHPYEENIDKLIESCQVVLVTSKLETFGATVIEAMSHYRPVISTKCGGPEEIIVDGVTGLLIESNASRELAEKLERFIAEPQLLRKMGIEGRKRWEEKYDLAQVMKVWIEFLKEVAKLPAKACKEETVEGQLQKKQPKKWLIVVKNLFNSSLKVGLVNTLEELKKQGKLEFKLANHRNALQEVDWADAVMFVRLAEEEMKEAFEKTLAQKKACLYYVDDALFAIPENVIAHSYYDQAKKELMAYYIKNSSATITCSPWLGEVCKEKYNSTIYTLHPTVGIPKKRNGIEKREKILIGFAGGLDYAPFLEEKKEMFLALYKKYKEIIQFEICGPPCSFATEVEAVLYHYTDYENYERLMEKRRWNIGLAFLPNTLFYNCKYYNKFLEYSRFGIATVYSDIPLYRYIINPGVNGLLADTTQGAWIQQIERLIMDQGLRESIAENAYNEVSQKFSPQAGADTFQEVFKDYL